MRGRLGTRRRAILVGLEPALSQARRLVEEAAPECEWSGRIDLDRVGAGVPAHERARRVAALVREERIQVLVLAVPDEQAESTWEVAEECRDLGVELYFAGARSQWFREGDRLERLGSLHLVRAATDRPLEQSAPARRAMQLIVTLLLLPLMLVSLGLCWLGLLLSGRSPRWEREVWDNGRSEPVPVWRLREARRGGAGLAERTGLARGLLLFWVLTGRVGLVGAPLRPFAAAKAAGERNGRALPAGLTGVWFVDPSKRYADDDLDRWMRRADLTTDLRILARSAARLVRLAGGRGGPSNLTGALS